MRAGAQSRQNCEHTAMIVAVSRVPQPYSRRGLAAQDDQLLAEDENLGFKSLAS